MVWTRFSDNHSGGDLKEAWQEIYIAMPKDEAVKYFEERFGHNPFLVGCECCGENYCVSEYETLAKATLFNRNPRHIKKKVEVKYDLLDIGESIPEGWELYGLMRSQDKTVPLTDYISREDVLILNP